MSENEKADIEKKLNHVEEIVIKMKAQLKKCKPPKKNSWLDWYSKKLFNVDDLENVTIGGSIKKTKKRRSTRRRRKSRFRKKSRRKSRHINMR